MSTKTQKPGEVSIDGRTYTIGHWDVAKALEVWAWLLEAVGPGLKEVFERVNKDRKAFEATKPIDVGDGVTAQTEADAEAALDKNIKLGVDIFGVLIETLRSNVPPKEYADRMLSFVTGDVLVDNRKINPALDFRGNLFLLHRVAAEVLKFQYKDFFDEALSIFKS